MPLPTVISGGRGIFAEGSGGRCGWDGGRIPLCHMQDAHTNGICTSGKGGVVRRVSLTVRRAMHAAAANHLVETGVRRCGRISRKQGSYFAFPCPIERPYEQIQLDKHLETVRRVSHDCEERAACNPSDPMTAGKADSRGSGHPAVRQDPTGGCRCAAPARQA